MKRSFSLTMRPALLGLLIALSLVMAACSSSSSYSRSPSTAPAGKGGVIKSANNPKFGEILVTADGRTLYANTVDTPGASKCTDSSCTDFWPPYIADTASPSAIGLPGTVGTINRPDGSRQVTYNQKPLYTFYQDRQPGDVGGDGLSDSGGTWHVALSSGSTSSSNNVGSGGYQYP